MFKSPHQSDTMMSVVVENKAITMLLTETKELLMPMKVTVFLFKKVVAMMLLMILLTEVLVYVMKTLVMMGSMPELMIHLS